MFLLKRFLSPRPLNNLCLLNVTSLNIVSRCYSKKKSGKSKREPEELENETVHHNAKDTSRELALKLKTLKFISQDAIDNSADSLSVSLIEGEYEKVYSQFQHFLARFMIQRLTPNYVENLKIENDHASPPLKSVATLYAKDPFTLIIKPLDASYFKKIEKSLSTFLNPSASASQSIGNQAQLMSMLGLSLQNVKNEEIHLVMPKWTTESRDKISKVATAASEDYRKHIRHIRQAVLAEIKSWIQEKDDIFRAEAVVQKSTDKYIKKINDYLELKKKEIHKC